MDRNHWQRRIGRLDPDVDFAEIYRILVAHEFPWDMRQSLSLALYRTYAVPSIARLLAATGELQTRTHKRYADTGLILDAVLEHGFGSATGRAAIRRMNQMHGAYTISNDDMRYVLSTFVVVPSRWIERFGWRPLTETERRASANHYRELGRHMNIKDSPRTYQEFAQYLDRYEREHFAYSPEGRAVSDATLSLLTGFHPRALRPLILRLTLALVDPPLRDAFRYSEPGPMAGVLAAAALRGRGAVVRRLPPRGRPLYVRQVAEFAVYLGGYTVDQLGTSPSSRSSPTTATLAREPTKGD